MLVQIAPRDRAAVELPTITDGDHPATVSRCSMLRPVQYADRVSSRSADFDCLTDASFSESRLR